MTSDGLAPDGAGLVADTATKAVAGDVLNGVWVRHEDPPRGKFHPNNDNCSVSIAIVQEDLAGAYYTRFVAQNGGGNLSRPDRARQPPPTSSSRPLFPEVNQGEVADFRPETMPNARPCRDRGGRQHLELTACRCVEDP